MALFSTGGADAEALRECKKHLARVTLERNQAQMELFNMRQEQADQGDMALEMAALKLDDMATTDTESYTLREVARWLRSLTKREKES